MNMGTAKPFDKISESQWRKIQLFRLAFDIVNEREEYEQLDTLDERLAFIKFVAKSLLKL